MSLIDQTRIVIQDVGKALQQRLSLSYDFLVMRKEDSHQNLVTEYDLWVQDELTKRFQTLLPEAAFFAEEKSNQDIKGLTWLIDPIDGTTNFIAAQKDYAISVALYDGPEPIFGIVYDPVADLCYWAEAGKDSYCNGRKLEKRSPKPLTDYLLDVSLSSMNNLSRRCQKPLFGVSKAIRGHRAYGCASMAICRIAEGRMDAYVSSKLFPWDYGAGKIILETCGGIVAPVYEKDSLFVNEQTAVLCCGDYKGYEYLSAFFRGDITIEGLLEKAKVER